MRYITLLLAFLSIAISNFAQLQLTVDIVADSGVKTAKFIKFDISNEQEIIYGFSFNKFAKDGIYPNNTLFQYNDNIDRGRFKITASLKSENLYDVSDSLFVDNKVSRIEIFIFISLSNSLNEYIKEIKILKFYNNLEYLKFSAFSSQKVGTEASFKISNVSDSSVYPYPNTSFFFGTLYESYKDQGWSQYYPLYNDIKFCDTVSLKKKLLVNQIDTAWTPNDDDCSKFIFKKHGSYYFELLYTFSDFEILSQVRSTKIKTITVGRQIYEFKI